MLGNVHKFRRLKTGDPTKLKVLSEDLPGRSRARPDRFVTVVVVLCLLTATGTFLAAGGWVYLPTELFDEASR